MPTLLPPVPYRDVAGRFPVRRWRCAWPSVGFALGMVALAVVLFPAPDAVRAAQSDESGGVVTIEVDDAAAPQDGAPAGDDAADGTGDADMAAPAEGEETAEEKPDGEEEAKADEQSAPEPVAGEAAKNEVPAAHALEPELPQIPSNGSFGRTIAIDVPAFRGLEPDLKLVYDSARRLRYDRRVKGLIAVGWRLSGLPTIERHFRGSLDPQIF